MFPTALSRSMCVVRKYHRNIKQWPIILDQSEKCKTHRKMLCLELFYIFFLNLIWSYYSFIFTTAFIIFISITYVVLK